MIYHIDKSISYESTISCTTQIAHVYRSQPGQLLEIDMTYRINADCVLEFTPVIVGNGSYKITLTFILEDQAQALIKGAYALGKDQRCQLITRQYHMGKDSISNLAINGIATDNAVTDYRGMIRIEKIAAGTQAHQENKTILFDSGARATSIPSIEVLNHDVSCAHGSAIGPLDAAHIRYCQARGIPEHAAKKIMVRSFFAKMLDNIPKSIQKERLMAQLINRIIE